MEKYVSAFLSVAAAVSIFVEVSKIKLNPWKSLFAFIGKSLNKDVKKELVNIHSLLNSQGNYLKDIEMLVDMNEIKRIRAEIFSFADSCKMGIEHTENAFLHIIDIHDDYTRLLEKYEMANGRITVEYNYIMSIYRQCVKKGDFGN